MKRAIYSALAVALLVGLCGCINQHCRRPLACMGGSCAQAPENCQSCCDDGNQNYFNPRDRCGKCRGRGCAECCQDPGPATGAITYPYYTTRGPRDFLAKNPPSIGP
jgi:hypothetical protein